MDWKAILQSRHKVVIVYASHYTVKRAEGSHEEYFKNMKSIRFYVDRRVPMLVNPVFYLDELEEFLQFKLVNNKIVCIEPKLRTQ